jgi:hypothetical protein
MLHFLGLVNGPGLSHGRVQAKQSADRETSNLYDLIKSLASCYSLIEMEVNSGSMSHRSDDGRDLDGQPYDPLRDRLGWYVAITRHRQASPVDSAINEQCDKGRSKGEEE